MFNWLGLLKQSSRLSPWVCCLTRIAEKPWPTSWPASTHPYGRCFSFKITAYYFYSLVWTWHTMALIPYVSLLVLISLIQYCVLPGGHSVVHGSGVWSLHSAHVHVGERHGLHHGGGALLLRGASAVPRQGVRRSQKKGRVSRASRWVPAVWLKQV